MAGVLETIKDKLYDGQATVQRWGQNIYDTLSDLPGTAMRNADEMVSYGAAAMTAGTVVTLPTLVKGTGALAAVNPIVGGAVILTIALGGIAFVAGSNLHGKFDGSLFGLASAAPEKSPTQLAKAQEPDKAQTIAHAEQLTVEAPKVPRQVAEAGKDTPARG